MFAFPFTFLQSLMLLSRQTEHEKAERTAQRHFTRSLFTKYVRRLARICIVASTDDVIKSKETPLPPWKKTTAFIMWSNFPHKYE